MCSISRLRSSLRSDMGNSGGMVTKIKIWAGQQPIGDKWRVCIAHSGGLIIGIPVDDVSEKKARKAVEIIKVAFEYGLEVAHTEHDRIVIEVISDG